MQRLVSEILVIFIIIVEVRLSSGYLAGLLRSEVRLFEPALYRRSVSLDKKHYSILSTRYMKWVLAIIMLGGNLAME